MSVRTGLSSEEKEGDGNDGGDSDGDEMEDDSEDWGHALLRVARPRRWLTRTMFMSIAGGQIEPM